MLTVYSTLSAFDKALWRAHHDGCKDRKLNPAEYDEQAENYFIFLAHQEGVRHRELYPLSCGDVNRELAEIAYWGTHYRRKETHFLLR